MPRSSSRPPSSPRSSNRMADDPSPQPPQRTSATSTRPSAPRSSGRATPSTAPLTFITAPSTSTRAASSKAAPTPASAPATKGHAAPADGTEGRVPHPRTGNDPELKVAGQNACRALFLARPDDIRRVYVTEDTLPHFKDLLKFCAQSRIAYHVKTDADLDQVAETVHHDGICLIAREQQEARPADVLAWARALHDDDAGVLVLLEGVKNPHNVGAILRVCAHFGVPFCLAVGETPALSPAAMRTAEGGAEHTRLVPVQDAMSLLQGLHRLGFAMLATSSHATMSLVRGDLPARAVVLFGSEGDGLSPGLLDVADATIAIPGSGALESLNVACASSVILWELWRARDDDARTQRPRPAPGRRAPRDDDHAAPRSPHAAPPIPPRASPPPRNAGPPATRSPRGGGDPGARERMSPRPR